jgi:thioredoxin 1
LKTYNQLNDGKRILFQNNDLSLEPYLKTKKMALEITDLNFAEITNTDKPVLIDFWAEWCGPCRMVTPVVEEIAKEYEGRAIVGKVNVDLNPETSMKFGIRNIPTIVFLKNGEVVDKSVGAVPKNVLTEKLDHVL